MRRHIFVWSLALVGAVFVWHAQQPGAAQGLSRRRPNVLFIAADDLNNDLGCYGHNLVKTPHIDRLAARGVRFDRAYNQYPLCSPSRTSLLTGLRPDTTRVYDLVTHFRTTVPDVVTLPQMFRQNGYVAARVGKIYHYGNPGDIGTNGLDDAPSWNAVVNPRGIDKDEEAVLTNHTPDRGLGSSLSLYPSPAPDEHHTDRKVTAETIALMEKYRDWPFFIAAGFYRPHCPYIAPKRYFDLYPLDRIAAPTFSPAELEQVPKAALWTVPPHFGVSERAQREAIQAYYASISFLDANIGRLLDALERLGLADTTIVVFWGDHGYLLGQHGQWMKQSLFEGSARAPLILAGPGIAKGGASSRTVEFVDVYPTLADLSGIRPPAGLAGRSLRSLLANPRTAWDRPALTQVRRNIRGNTFMGYSVRTERWRYTEWDEGRQGTELYDEAHDPRELRNLAADPKHAKTVAEMELLLQHVRGTSRTRVVRLRARSALTARPRRSGEAAKAGEGDVVVTSSRMARLTLLALGLLLVPERAPAPSSQATRQQPQLELQQITGARPRDIIFILTDDHRYDAMGFMGHPFVETPNLDYLARYGVHIQNAFTTTALCSPSRATILTGQYAHRHRVVDNNNMVPPGTTFLSQCLQAAGYDTAFIGKWHMGRDSDDPQPGFGHWVSFRGQGAYLPNPNGLNVNGARVPQKGYITDELTDYAIDWLKGRSGKTPFFLYFSHKGVHSDFVPADRHKNRYGARALAPPKTMAPELAAGFPMWVQNQRNSHHGVEFPYHGNLDLEAYYRRYLETLVAQGIEVRRAEAPLKIGGRTIPVGAYLVANAQPSGRLVRNLLDPHTAQDDPFVKEQDRRRRMRLGDQIYAITAWSLPLLFDVEVLTSPTSADVTTTPVTAQPRSGARRASAGQGWLSAAVGQRHCRRGG